MNFNDASIIITPNGVKAGKLYAVKPTDGSGDLTVTRATSATRVNASGLIELVGANVPRLDYSNGSCPSILVEPQRTNLLLRSQQFSSSSWSSAGTIVDNVAISPDGTQNATEMSESPYVYQGNTFGICTVSCYFKKTTSNTIAIRMDTTEVNYITFNINTGIVADVPNGFTASITSVGNGWYRCTATSTASVGLVLFISPCYIWGAQCEVGSYATSYIPTIASSVTRNADVISKTGIAGITTLTTTFEDNTTQVLTNPTSYTMPNGRIKKVVGI